MTASRNEFDFLRLWSLYWLFLAPSFLVRCRMLWDRREGARRRHAARTNGAPSSGDHMSDMAFGM